MRDVCVIEVSFILFCLCRCTVVCILKRFAFGFWFFKMSNIQYKCGYCKFFINSYCENYAEHLCFKEKLMNLPPEKTYAIVVSPQNMLELGKLPNFI